MGGNFLIWVNQEKFQKLIAFIDIFSILKISLLFSFPVCDQSYFSQFFSFLEKTFIPILKRIFIVSIPTISWEAMTVFLICFFRLFGVPNTTFYNFILPYGVTYTSGLCTKPMLLQLAHTHLNIIQVTLLRATERFFTWFLVTTALSKAYEPLSGRFIILNMSSIKEIVK